MHRTQESVAEELVSLRRDLAAVQADLARATRPPRRRGLVRLLPLGIVALLVALVPLATLAANPFGDLNPGSPHNGNIDAIFAAGITTGCDSTSYCPSANVTREEMASFLARTAGLGGNPPIANALTATNATNAQNAASAQTAQNAANAATLGGQPPSAYLPAQGDTTYRYPGALLQRLIGSTVVIDVESYGAGKLSMGANLPETALLMPLPRPTAEHGRFLAVKSVRICYQGDVAGGIRIAGTQLTASEIGSVKVIVEDLTPRTSTTSECYDLAPATPQAIAGTNALYLAFENTSGAARTIRVHSVALTLTPLAAGAAEVPVDIDKP